jgi:hypothetical protein
MFSSLLRFPGSQANHADDVVSLNRIRLDTQRRLGFAKRI